MPDLLITGGTLVDGTGRPGRRADVLVQGDRVVAVGAALPRPDGVRLVDAAGCVVAPGFVDAHSHSDFTLLVNRTAESALLQGVTTEVVGNCGLSFAPAYRPKAITESLPAPLAGLSVTWRTFGEYLATLEQGGLAINIAHLVGLNALRLSVCGFEARPLTGAETAQACRWLGDALDEGAWGFSAGLEYAPGRNATADELVALCQAVAARDAVFAVHMRNQDDGYLAAVDEVLAVTARSEVRLQISHLPPHRHSASPGAANAALERIRRARVAGADVAFDVHPYLWGLSFLTAALPTWAFEGGTGALLKRLADPRERQRLRAYADPLPKQIKAGRWDTVIPRNLVRAAEDNGYTLAAIAKRRGQDPYETLFDLLLGEGDRVPGLLWIFEIVDEDDLHLLMRQPECIVESDGMVLASRGQLAREALHPRCFGWTARFLGEHVRDKGVLPLEEAVRRMTSLPAERFGLCDRGVVRPGGYADLVVFDFDSLRDRASYASPNRSPEGIRLVVVNGLIAAEDGTLTPHLNGRVLRKGGRA